MNVKKAVNRDHRTCRIITKHITCMQNRFKYIRAQKYELESSGVSLHRTITEMTETDRCKLVRSAKTRKNRQSKI